MLSTAIYEDELINAKQEAIILSKASKALSEIITTWRKQQKISSYIFEIYDDMTERQDTRFMEAVIQYGEPLQEEKLSGALHSAMKFRAQEQWDLLFADCSSQFAGQLSRDERIIMGISRTALTYGEVHFETLAAALFHPTVRLKPGGVFVDLGSGTGRAVFAAALLHDFDYCIGIEISGFLHAQAIVQHQYYARDFLSRRIPRRIRSAQTILFNRGNYLGQKWSHADVVFINSTCFDEELFANTAAQALQLKEGALILIVSKRLSEEHFELLHEDLSQFSWGVATLSVYCRRAKPSEAKEQVKELTFEEEQRRLLLLSVDLNLTVQKVPEKNVEISVFNGASAALDNTQDEVPVE
jgi:hypothetical protein